MWVYKIHKKNCKGFIVLMTHFWWGDKEKQRRMHWVAWWKMCVTKNQGGMSFHAIHCSNLAMLAKQAWRLLENPDSLCASILRARGYLNGDLLNTKLKKGSSFTWGGHEFSETWFYLASGEWPEYQYLGRWLEPKYNIIVNPIWSRIWELSCPAKVKIFAWRTLHGTLPCMVCYSCK